MAMTSVGKLTCKLICKERCTINAIYVATDISLQPTIITYIDIHYSLLQKHSEDSKL